MVSSKIFEYVLNGEKVPLHIVFYEDIEKQYAPKIVSNQKNLILEVHSKADLTRLQERFLHYFPKDHPFEILSADSHPDTEFVLHQGVLEEIKNVPVSNDAFILYIPPLSHKKGLIDFQELIAHLRSEDGCPWDRKQTHKSLRTNLLEETYEVLTALDREDCEGLEEELGDLLLQIVLHAQIASEAGNFNIEDVTTGIFDKLVYRHPHVFADTDVGGADEVIKNWEVLKAAERKEHKKAKGILTSVPKSMPSLALAQDYQKRAARVGFDWRTIEPVREKVLEELEEVSNAVNKEEQGKELGDVLFALVNLVRWYGFDAESILREASTRFADRFEYIEECVEKEGKTFSEFSLDELDAFWDEAKANGK